MKRFLIVFMCILLTCSNLTMAANKVVIEEAYGCFENIEPQVINGVFYVPVRDMAKNCGYSLKWNNVTKNIIISGDNKRVVINIGDNTCFVDGVQQEIRLSVLNDYSLVPVEDWARLFDKYAYWNSNEELGAVVSPQEITMEEYLTLVEYCGRVITFNSAYSQVKYKTTSLITNYSSKKNSELIQGIKETIYKDLYSSLEEINNFSVPQYALDYKNATYKLCKTKYDYINYYFDHIEENRVYEEPLDNIRENLAVENIALRAQLNGFYNKMARIDCLDSKHLQQVNDFSREISGVNEQMLAYIYHIDSSKELNKELIKYGEGLKAYSKEYRFRVTQISQKIFTDDTFKENIMAIDYILSAINYVGDAFVKAGNGQFSLERATLEENYVDFIWENISQLVIAEHFGFSFDYIYDYVGQSAIV